MAVEARTIHRLRLGMGVAALVGIASIAWLARGALFPFLIGGLIAYVIAPVVEAVARLQPWYGRRPGLARGTAVLSVYAIVGGALTVSAVFAVPAMVREVGDLVDAVPDLWDEAQNRVESWMERYNREVPDDVRRRINDAVKDTSSEIGNVAESLVTHSVGLVFSTVAALLGYISVPFFVFYALKDRDYALGRFYALFPERLQPDVRECVRIANHVFGAYIRGQLFLGFVIFLITFIGLHLLGVEFALGLAVIAGFTELIPIIGPIIGAVPAIIVVLATEPDHWWWIVLFYFGVQAAENYILVPRVHSRTVSMHPAMVLVLLAVGGSLFGIWGVLLAVPVAATIRDVYSYIYRRLGEAEEAAEASPAPGHP